MRNRRSERWYIPRLAPLVKTGRSPAKLHELSGLSRRAARAYPRSSAVLTYRAQAMILCREGRSASMLSLFRRAAHLDRANAEAWQGIAFVHNLHNRNGLAERYQRIAARLCDSPWNVEFLAMIIAERGRRQEAFRMLRRSRHRRHPWVKKAAKFLLANPWYSDPS